MVKHFQGIRKIGHTIFLAMPKLFNILALVILILFIYTILGCFLFSQAQRLNIILDDYINFKNFFYGMMTLFKITTADNWSLIMHELSLQFGNCLINFNILSLKIQCFKLQHKINIKKKLTLQKKKKNIRIAIRKLLKIFFSK